MISCVKFKLGRGVVIILVFKRPHWLQSGEFMGVRVTSLLLETGNTETRKAEVGEQVVKVTAMVTESLLCDIRFVPNYKVGGITPTLKWS